MSRLKSFTRSGWRFQNEALMGLDLEVLAGGRRQAAHLTYFFFLLKALRYIGYWGAFAACARQRERRRKEKG